MMKHERYDIRWFKNAKGETVSSQEELKQMFQEYRWPMVVDLWLPIAAAAVLGVLQWLFITTFRQNLWNVCKEKENIKLRTEKSLKSTECMFKGIYFTCTTIGGTYVLQNSTFIPKLLFPIYSNVS